MRFKDGYGNIFVIQNLGLLQNNYYSIHRYAPEHPDMLTTLGLLYMQVCNHLDLEIKNVSKFLLICLKLNL